MSVLLLLMKLLLLSSSALRLDTFSAYQLLRSSVPSFLASGPYTGVMAASSSSSPPEGSTPFCAAFVTVPNMEVAKKMASGLVSNKLAACVNVIPGVTSIYEWEGKIEEDSELILMIKSRCSRTEELTEYVKKNHPYDVCEVITTPILGGNPAYLKWLGDIVKEK